MMFELNKCCRLYFKEVLENFLLHKGSKLERSLFKYIWYVICFCRMFSVLSVL